jgi:hypothetical protein
MKAMTSAAVRTWDDETTRTGATEATDAPRQVARRRSVPPTITMPPRRVAPVRTVPAPARRPVAPERRAATAPRAPFAILVVGLLGGALVGLLLLNTALAQQSFTESELQRENQQLQERRQALQEDIARESSPQVLHEKARRLGMRDAGDPGFVTPRR